MEVGESKKKERKRKREDKRVSKVMWERVKKSIWISNTYTYPTQPHERTKPKQKGKKDFWRSTHLGVDTTFLSLWEIVFQFFHCPTKHPITILGYVDEMFVGVTARFSWQRVTGIIVIVIERSSICVPLCHASSIKLF